MTIPKTISKPMNKHMPEHMKDMVRLDETEGLLKSSFRTMALFEYFADVQRPLTIGDICDGLDIPQSSGSALTKSLTDSGFLIRNIESRTYFPSIRLFYLSQWIGQDSGFLRSLCTIANTLKEQTGETVTLAMRNGIYSQYIYVTHEHTHESGHVETGSLRPLVCSATGWALLARETDQEIGKLIRRTQADTQNPYWQDTAGGALSQIRDVEKNGYSYYSDKMAEGAAGIAICLTSPDGHMHIAIGVAGSTQNIAKKRGLITQHIMAIKHAS